VSDVILNSINLLGLVGLAVLGVGQVINGLRASFR
jgi:hypothetical protein